MGDVCRRPQIGLILNEVHYETVVSKGTQCIGWTRSINIILHQ